MTAARVPVRAADCFLLAMTAFMRRTGQGAFITGSVLELERAPDLAKLRPALVRMAEKHPLLRARLRRDWRTWLPYWQVPEPVAGLGLPLGLWREKGAPGMLGEAAAEVAGAQAQLQAILAGPLPDGFNARVDVVERRDGRCFVALAWSHLVIDGKGAELLLAEIARLGAGADVPCKAKETVPPEMTWAEKIKKTKPAIYHLENLAKTRIRSLAGPRPRRGGCSYQMIALDEAASDRVRARVEATIGALFPLGFFVACAARAHDRVLAQRGTAPAG